MSSLKSIYYFFLAVIPLATIVRIGFCVMVASMDEDGGQYRKRAVNALVFCVVALVLYLILGVYLGYFGESLQLFGE